MLASDGFSPVIAVPRLQSSCLFMMVSPIPNDTPPLGVLGAALNALQSRFTPTLPPAGGAVVGRGESFVLDLIGGLLLGGLIIEWWGWHHHRCL
jgi:hypothetical protein